MCLDLSGASRIPVTASFRTLPGGDERHRGRATFGTTMTTWTRCGRPSFGPFWKSCCRSLAMSAWGRHPTGWTYFPAPWTPTAKEVAEIAKTKSEAIVSGYRAGLLNVDTAQKGAQETGGRDRDV